MLSATETAATTALPQELPQAATGDDAGRQGVHEPLQMACSITPQQQHMQPTVAVGSAVSQQQWQQLCSSLADLDVTSDLLVQLVQAVKQHAPAGPQQQAHDMQQTAGSSTGQDGRGPHSSTATSSNNSGDAAAAVQVQELQQQLAALLAEKQRIEADRQDMALQQGKYKGNIAQLEGALAFSERKVKDQLATIEKLQAQVSSLTTELHEARGAAAQTPDRCRTAARALQEEADRATLHARSNEVQVKKLRHIVQLEARQLAELLDFAEQERLTLLEKEAALQQELEQLRSRATQAEAGAEQAAAEAAALQQQLEATQGELAASQALVTELEGALADSKAQLQQAHSKAAVLTGERDAAARNLRRAEAELDDVTEYSTKMFRQVRFISHVLDKNGAVLGKMPEFASLTRDLRAFVAANARTREPRDDRSNATTAGAGPAATAAAPTPSASNADTTASGMRDVAGKA